MVSIVIDQVWLFFVYALLERYLGKSAILIAIKETARAHLDRDKLISNERNQVLTIEANKHHGKEVTDPTPAAHAQPRTPNITSTHDPLTFATLADVSQHAMGEILTDQHKLELMFQRMEERLEASEGLLLDGMEQLGQQVKDIAEIVREHHPEQITLDDIAKGSLSKENN